ncbi:hypothetical protein Sru01_11280 [Sphaerisporangium rufum]|uniref:Uncharacterized protein n=1 Tax=Sphaerisporangium rufum TaxID=1381558 RepID=A0A919QXX3_9ACTN|nr:ABC transporter [Sphaerisporangium rufum]GII76146.1 hypothetical protein Sru01_11280 [Sphaerisporangium rufum]
MKAAPLGRPPADIRPADLVGAEVTKMVTLPATWAALAVALAAGLLLGLAAGTDAVRVATAGGPTPIARLGIVLLAPGYAFAAVPVLAAGGEYRGGQLRASLLAVPDRHRFFLAKLLASLAVPAVAALPVVLPGHAVQYALGDAPLGQALAGTAADAAVHLLLGLAGFGFALLTRTAVTPLAVLVALPVLVSPLLGGLAPGVVRLLPHEAALSFLGASGSPELALPRPVGLLVLLAWALAAVLGAWAATARRDC